MKKIKVFLIIFILVIFSSCNRAQDSIVGNKNYKGNTLLTISFIDVGQGDSILIKTPDGRFILIDSGASKEKDKLFKFLKGNNISKFDVIIGTHPHEDHIGNMEELIKRYEIGSIYLPKVSSNTQTFKTLINEIKSKKLEVKKAFSGVSFEIDKVKFKFLAPNKNKYKDLNNYSGVLKVEYGKNSFLLMGDAEKLSEREILGNGYDIRAKIIKIGHHGSNSSSSKSFIKAVNPEYAVISCGKNNDYGHPHSSTLKLLNSLRVKLYRTDIEGTVIFTSDGENLNKN